MRSQEENMEILKGIRKVAGSLFDKSYNKTGSLINGEDRTCVKCGETKNIDKFYKSRRNKDNYAIRYTTECKACSLKNRREHYAENKDRILDEHRFRSYGLSKEEYYGMLDNQGGTCAICKRKEWSRASVTNNIRALAVDHCHVKGNVRGLLCRACNLAIGYFEDNTESLGEAIKYLEKAGEGYVQTTT